MPQKKSILGRRLNQTREHREYVEDAPEKEMEAAANKDAQQNLEDRNANQYRHAKAEDAGHADDLNGSENSENIENTEIVPEGASPVISPAEPENIESQRDESETLPDDNHILSDDSTAKDTADGGTFAAEDISSSSSVSESKSSSNVGESKGYGDLTPEEQEYIREYYSSSQNIGPADHAIEEDQQNDVSDPDKRKDCLISNAWMNRSASIEDGYGILMAVSSNHGICIALSTDTSDISDHDVPVSTCIVTRRSDEKGQSGIYTIDISREQSCCSLDIPAGAYKCRKDIMNYTATFMPVDPEWSGKKLCNFCQYVVQNALRMKRMFDTDVPANHDESYNIIFVPAQ